MAVSADAALRVCAFSAHVQNVRCAPVLENHHFRLALSPIFTHAKSPRFGQALLLQRYNTNKIPFTKPQIAFLHNRGLVLVELGFWRIAGSRRSPILPVIWTSGIFLALLPRLETGMSATRTEMTHAEAQGFDTRPPREALAILAQAQAEAAQAVQAAVPDIARAARLAADCVEGGGRLVYAAAGSSGLMALADALELPGTYGLARDRIKILLAGAA